MKKRNIVLIILLVILVDQIAKFGICKLIPEGTTVGGFIALTNVSNTGAAYNFREQQYYFDNNCRCNNNLCFSKVYD